VKPTLIVFAGLPGVGKSTLAARVARALPAAVLPVDPVDRALAAALPGDPAFAAGVTAYAIVAALAEHQLRIGLPVIVDAVNPVAAARRQWVEIADRTGALLRIVEVLCGDVDEHRRRVEERTAADPAGGWPSWEVTLRRRAEYEPYIGRRVVVDTSAPGDPLRGLLSYIRS
jgi:predicted kinase